MGSFADKTGGLGSLPALLLLLATLGFWRCSGDQEHIAGEAGADQSQVHTPDHLAFRSRDSLLLASVPIIQEFDSLQGAGVAGADTLQRLLKEYNNLIRAWYESSLPEDIKRCEEVKSIFRMNNRLWESYIEVYREKIDRYSRGSLNEREKKLYQENLAGDIAGRFAVYNSSLSKIHPHALNIKEAQCPSSAGKERPDELAATNQGRNPISQVQAYFKDKVRSRKLQEDLDDLRYRH
jgi:hypothetical protein